MNAAWTVPEYTQWLKAGCHRRQVGCDSRYRSRENRHVARCLVNGAITSLANLVFEDQRF